MYYANNDIQEVSTAAAARTGSINLADTEGTFKTHYGARWWYYMIFLVIFTIIAIVWSVFSIIDSHKCSKYEEQLNGSTPEDEEWREQYPATVRTCEKKTYVWLPIIMWLIPIIIFISFYFKVLKTHRCLKNAGTNKTAEEKCMIDYNTRVGISEAVGDAGAAAVIGSILVR